MIQPRMQQTPRKINVVRIVTRLNIGGPSMHVALLAGRLDPARFATCLIVGRPDPGEGSRLPWVQDGPARVFTVDALRRPLHPWHDLRTFWEIVQILWRQRPRVIHTHMAKAGALGRLAGWLYNRLGPGRHPGQRALLVHTFHGHVLEGYFSPWASRGFTRIERWLARRTDWLVAVSGRIRDELHSKGIGESAQWRVIPLGVDFTELQSLPLPNGAAPLRCGMVGRLVPIKNPSLLLSALSRLLQRDSKGPVHGRFIGDGPLRPELEEEARRLGLDGMASFSGWVDSQRACYENLDVVCLTSRNEGTPVSLIEAMAAGRPVVATAVGGVGDLLGLDTHTADIPRGTFRITARGVLVQEGDAEGLSAALERLAGDPQLRRRLAQAGRAYACMEFSPERLVRAISELYEQGLRP